MRVNLSVLVAMMMCLAILGCPATPPDPPADLPDDPSIDPGNSPDPTLDGVWKGKSWVLGSPVDSASDYVETVTFVGNSLDMIAFAGGRQRAFQSGYYIVGTTTEFPKPLDMNVVSSSSGRTGLNRGLYIIQDNTLYLSFGGVGNDRTLTSSLFPSVGSVFVGTRQASAKHLDLGVSGFIGGAVD